MRDVHTHCAVRRRVPAMRSYLLVSVFILGGFASVVAGAAPPMLVRGATIEVADQVYVIPDQRVSLVPNVGIIVGSESVMVVDSGMGPANAEIVREEVRRLSDLPIRYFVSTHFHPEHYFGAQSFPKETVILSSIRQHRDLREKGESYIELFLELFGEDVRELLEPVRLMSPDITFAREARIDLGEFPVELHHFGRAAHTRGDTVVYLPERRLVFAGGLTPNRFFPIFADADSSVTGWLESLDRLEQLGFDRIVPGHGEVADKSLIATVREYLRQVHEGAARLKAEGVTLTDAQTELSARFQAQYDDWDEANWIAAAVEIVYAEADAAR